MTAFEQFFKSLKHELDRDTLYDIWPDFTPAYDIDEFSYITTPQLGTIMLLNCAACEGPSDLRHPNCLVCVTKRNRYAVQTKHTPNTQKVALTRFYQLPSTSSPPEES